MTPDRARKCARAAATDPSANRPGLRWLGLRPRSNIAFSSRGRGSTGCAATQAEASPNDGFRPACFPGLEPRTFGKGRAMRNICGLSLGVMCLLAALAGCAGYGKPGGYRSRPRLRHHRHKRSASSPWATRMRPARVTRRAGLGWALHRTRARGDWALVHEGTGSVVHVTNLASAARPANIRPGIPGLRRSRPDMDLVPVRPSHTRPARRSSRSLGPRAVRLSRRRAPGRQPCPR